MTLRTKGEQKAYLDGFEMCAECIEKYLTDDGKQKLKCLLMAVKNAVEIEDIESQESEDKCKNCKYYCNPDYTRCHECKAESEEKNEIQKS